MTSGRDVRRRASIATTTALIAWLTFPSPQQTLPTVSSAHAATAGATVAKETTSRRASEALHRTLGSGETLMEVLEKVGIDRDQADRAIRVLRHHVNLRQLKIGQPVEIFVHPGTTPLLIGLVVDVDGGRGVGAYRDFDGGYRALTGATKTVTGEIGGIGLEVLPDGSPHRLTREVKLERGQSVIELLRGTGVDRDDAGQAVRVLDQKTNLRRLPVGTSVEVSVTLPSADEPRPQLNALTLHAPSSDLRVVRTGGGAFMMADTRRPERAAPPKATARPASAQKPEPVSSAEAHETAPAAIDRFTSHTLALKRGETPLPLMVRAGVDRTEAARAVAILRTQTDLRRLQIGDEITVFFMERKGARQFAGVRIAGDGGTVAMAGILADGRFSDRLPVSQPALKPGTVVAAAAAPAPITEAEPVETAEIEPAPVRPEPDSPPAIAEPTTVSPATEPSPEAGRTVAAVVDLPHATAATQAQPIAAATMTPAADLQRKPIRRGDTLMELLVEAGGSRQDADSAIKALRRLVDPRKLRVGQTVEVAIDLDSQRMAGFILILDDNGAVVVERTGDKTFEARRTSPDSVNSGLFASTVPQLPSAEQGPASPGDLAEADMIPTAEPRAELIPVVAGTPFSALANVERVTMTLGRGDTLMKLLVDAGTDRNDAHAAIDGVRPVLNPRRLRAGTDIAIAFHPTAGLAKPILAGFSVDLDTETRVEVMREADGKFVPKKVTKPLFLQTVRRSGAIRHSLYGDAVAAGVSPSVLLQLIKMFSYDVDFQRDIQNGDHFELMYETYVDESGNEVRDGDVLYASMTLSGITYPLYRFTLGDGTTDYFNDKGQSARKALLRTPIDGARLSSGFGMRKHPVLGYSKMHKGLDFAAPRGTPIFAAGDGVIERASKFSSYGLYVRIRHNTEYDTAYAHMNRIGKGIYPGKRVRQGDIIGYVGTTGRSTGPHLHYEVLKNGTQVNPMKVKLPTGIILTGKDLRTFEAKRNEIRSAYANLPGKPVLVRGMSSGE